MAKSDREIIDALERRRGGMDAEWEVWKPHFRELRDSIQPSRGRFDPHETRDYSTLNKKIIDSTARQSLNTLVSGLMAGMTSPSRAWFKLGLYDDSLLQSYEVQQYLATVQTRMYTVLRASNVYSLLQSCYADLGLYGTFAGMLVEDVEDIVRGHAFPMGSYRIMANEHGIVDCMHRDILLTVGQVVEKFGYANVSDKIRRDYDKGQIHQQVTICHAVEPRRERDAMSPFAENKPWASYYWEKGEKDKLLRKSGFSVNPILGPAWERIEGETYSVSSPGMNAIGDAVQLQVQHRDKAMAIQMSYKPPLQAPAGFKERYRSIPGSVTTLSVTDLQKGGLKPTHEVNPDIRGLLMDIDETQGRIRSAFYADLFLMLSTSDRRQMTATEVAERHEEKLLVLGPVLESLEHNLLQPIIEVTFAHMNAAGILPPPPQEVQGRPLRVEYISLLAQAQRAVGVASIERTVGFAGALAQVAPTVLDVLDHDTTLREFSEQIGPPPNILRPPSAVEEIRQQRAQQQMAQAAMEQAQPLAQAASLLQDTSQRGQEGLQRSARVL